MRVYTKTWGLHQNGVYTKKWGAHIYLRVHCVLTTLSDDAQAVVVKVSEAVCAALNEFHFPMEAFGDGVGSGEAPHGADGLGPGGEGLGEGMQALEADFIEVIDMLEEGLGVLAAGGFCLTLLV